MTLASGSALALVFGLVALLTIALAAPSPAVLLLMPQTSPFVTAVVASAAFAWTMTQGRRHGRRLHPSARAQSPAIAG